MVNCSGNCRVECKTDPHTRDRVALSYPKVPPILKRMTDIHISIKHNIPTKLQEFYIRQPSECNFIAFYTFKTLCFAVVSFLMFMKPSTQRTPTPITVNALSICKPAFCSFAFQWKLGCRILLLIDMNGNKAPPRHSTPLTLACTLQWGACQT